MKEDASNVVLEATALGLRTALITINRFVFHKWTVNPPYSRVNEPYTFILKLS